ncbi:MAG: YkvA family protein [Pirellulaceae bacterium]
MEYFFETLQMIVVCGSLLGICFLVLLALPKSRLRSCLLELAKYVMAAGFAVLLLSPIDLVPDVIPLLGQLDDIGYIAGGITSVVSAVKERRSRRLLSK